MPISSQNRFDELNPKYILGCCHVKTAALLIGAFQLIGFFCNLTSVAVLRRDNRHTVMTSPSAFKPSAVHFDADFNATPSSIDSPQGKSAEKNSGDFWGQMALLDAQLSSGADRATAASMDMAWSGVMAMCVVLSFYAIRFTRPYLMAPKLILDAVTAGLVSVGAATNLILIAGRSSTPRVAWSALFVELVGAMILLYIFGVSLHCFKYLMEKRAFLNAAASSGLVVFPLPASWLNPQSSHQAEASYDVPPAYPGPAQENKASLGPKQEAESAPPSYEEAKKLRGTDPENPV